MTDNYPYPSNRDALPEPSAAEAEELAELLEKLHNESDIDGYGDEGEGYDYEKQAKRLFASEWFQRKLEANR